jgi:uncharacterized membrane protein YeaQ/YmgE (transglycosylase-associated protein family)
VLGLLSLIVWSLVVVISLKYLTFVMRTDNDGEGGILALTTLAAGALRDKPNRRKTRGLLVTIGLFGAALLYGDGVITPSISVLSAIEGTTRRFPQLDRVVPLALAVLVALFAAQSRGTGAIGRAFGPVMIVWFTVIGVLGASHVADEPGVLAGRRPDPRRPVLRRQRRHRVPRPRGGRPDPWSGARRSTPTWATSAGARSRSGGTASCCPACCSSTWARERCCWPSPTRCRADVTDIDDGVYQVVLHFGFMDRPDVPKALADRVVRRAVAGGLLAAIAPRWRGRSRSLPTRGAIATVRTSFPMVWFLDPFGGDMDLGSLIAALILGFVCGAIARAIVPNDAFEHMEGWRSWALSTALGLLGALLGYWIFAGLLGIGDDDAFDWGGIVGALIGAIVVVAVGSWVLRRSGRSRGPLPG